MKPLWDHQAAAIDRLRDSVRAGKRRPVLQAPTGYGKTRVAAEIITRALEHGRRALFIVPALSLIDQAVRDFRAEGIEHIGVIQQKHALTDPTAPVQVASVQTLERRRAAPEADIVLIDECHRWYKTYERLMTLAPGKAYFIGLSATPWTRGLGKWFDDLIVSATTQELIDKGFLSPFRVFCAGHPDLSDVRTVAGDYHEQQLSEVMNQDTLVGDAVETWLAHGKGRPTLCFGVDRAHASNLRDRFIAKGVRAAFQDAYTTDAEREAIRQGFQSGAYEVVCNIGTLTTGIDWDVRCITMARPTKSAMLFCQIIGRGLRTAPGKDDLLILDHSDNHRRLGFVTDIKHETLDIGEPRPRERDKDTGDKARECPKCKWMTAKTALECPFCGHVFWHPLPVEDTRRILTEAGAYGHDQNKLDLQLGLDRIALRDFFVQLKGYALRKRYKPNWPKVTYKATVGSWPPWDWEAMLPEPTTPPVQRLIEGRLSEYRRQMEFLEFQDPAKMPETTA